MSAPVTSYQDAASAFASGEMGFEDLLLAVKHLPPPQLRQKKIRTLAEIYEDEAPEPPNSVLWLGALYSRGRITKDQLMLLTDAAKEQSPV